ncbi:DUF3566 domain-containing protein [Cellulomonas palmilytica]|uniref:DUF3566 domain-containing protein n=1 Tax=Cellulomonas palmilytica TaxID=2608402 RepID=UPI001F30E65D|nr:DUF3566 domain-containing protein [Cellulomonas palmilytica]UJP40550.1 DUF3566 domain-containing protein [Cellulomonas palmilytica]
MTDPAPPSIPPRNRPSSSSSARTVASPGGRDSGGNGPSHGTAVRPDPVPTPPRDDEHEAPDTERTDHSERTEHSDYAARVGTTSASPSGTQPHDPPTPLMAAVDKTSAWLKKAAGATSAKISTATRPRNEDPAMTTTPTAPPASAGATGTNPPSVPPRTSTTAPASGTAGARPATGRIPTVTAAGGPRRVRLAISRIDPWSVMKLSFLLSVAFGILLVVAVAVVWYTLNGLHVFTNINDLVTQVTGTESNVDVLQYVEFKRVISGATLVAVVDVFLLTALATIGAFLYNIVAALVGGLHVTMTDE